MSWRNSGSLLLSAEAIRGRLSRGMKSSGQVGGTHYQKTIQPWDAMGAWMTPEAFAGFLTGNVIKYIARYKDKNGVEDLRKAQHYLNRLIEVETKS